MDIIHKESKKESYVVQIEIKKTWITQKEYSTEEEAREGLKEYIQKAIKKNLTYFHYRVVKIEEVCEAITAGTI